MCVFARGSHMFKFDHDSPGEDAQEGQHIQRVSINNSIIMSFRESSAEDIMDNSSNSLGKGIETSSLASPPPPPPALFLGYTLPPGHPCKTFALPPPPADKKRTGPRRKFCSLLTVLYSCTVAIFNINFHCCSMLTI